jgi:hypothetical protein
MTAPQDVVAWNRALSLLQASLSLRQGDLAITSQGALVATVGAFTGKLKRDVTKALLLPKFAATLISDGAYHAAIIPLLCNKLSGRHAITNEQWSNFRAKELERLAQPSAPAPVVADALVTGSNGPAKRARAGPKLVTPHSSHTTIPLEHLRVLLQGTCGCCLKTDREAVPSPLFS